MSPTGHGVTAAPLHQEILPRVDDRSDNYTMLIESIDQAVAMDEALSDCGVAYFRHDTSELWILRDRFSGLDEL